MYNARICLCLYWNVPIYQKTYWLVSTCTRMYSYVLFMKVHTSTYQYILVQEFAVQDGTSWYNTVHDGTYKYILVYHCTWVFEGGTSKYILVHTLMNWFDSCWTRPPGRPESWIFAAAPVPSQDTLVQAQWCLLFWFSCRRPGTPSLGRGGGLGRGGCGRVCCPPCTAAAHAGSSILLTSLWCYNDVVAPTESPSIQSRMHNCGNCMTACQFATKHGFANQQTSKLTTWKYILIWPKNTVNKFSNFWLKNSTLCY